MARRRRTRTQSSAERNGNNPGEARASQQQLFGQPVESTIVPQVLMGAVNGVEVVAGALLQLARDVLVSAVSGAADIGDAALTATVSGARGVVSAASRTVESIGGAAKSSFQDAMATAWSPRGRATARTAARRPLATMPARTADVPAERAANSGRTRRPRAARANRAREAA